MNFISRSLATVVVAGLVSGAASAAPGNGPSRPDIPPGLAGIIGIGTQGIIGIGAQGIIGIGTQGIIGIGAQGIIGIGTPGAQGIIGIGTQGIIGIGSGGQAQTQGIIGIGGDAQTLGIIGIGGDDGGEAQTLGIIGIGGNAETQGIIGIGGDAEMQGIIGIGFQEAEASHLTLGVSASDETLMVGGTVYDAGGATVPSGQAVLVYGPRDALGFAGTAWLAIPFLACSSDGDLMSVLAFDATISADLWIAGGVTEFEVCGIAFELGDATPAAGLYRLEGQRNGMGVTVSGTYRID